MVMAYRRSNYERCAMWLPTKGLRTSHLEWIKGQKLLSQVRASYISCHPPLIPSCRLRVIVLLIA